MTHPHHLSVLTYEQIRRLIYVMEQTIAIHGRGNFPTIHVTLKDFIKLVKSKLENDENSINIRDIRLNGGGASYILSPENSHQYNDLDLIFATDLSDENKFGVIRDVVLDCLMDFLPSSTDQDSKSNNQQREEENHCSQEPNAADHKLNNRNQTDQNQDQNKLDITANNQDQNFSSAYGSGDTKSKIISNADEFDLIKSAKGKGDDGDESDDNIVVTCTSEDVRNDTNDKIVPDKNVQATSRSSSCTRTSIIKSSQPPQSSVSSSHSDGHLMINRSAIKEAYVHKMVKVTDSDRWSLISLGVHQDSTSGNNTTTQVQSIQGQGQILQHQHQNFHHSTPSQSSSSTVQHHKKNFDTTSSSTPSCSFCQTRSAECSCCCCYEQQTNSCLNSTSSSSSASSVSSVTSSSSSQSPCRSSKFNHHNHRQHNNMSSGMSGMISGVASSIGSISSVASFGSSNSLPSNNSPPSLTSYYGRRNSTKNQQNQRQMFQMHVQMQQIANAQMYRNNHHQQDQHHQQYQPQAPNSIELKFVDRMRRKFEFSVDSFQIILDSLILFYDWVPHADLSLPIITNLPQNSSQSSPHSSCCCNNDDKMQHCDFCSSSIYSSYASSLASSTSSISIAPSVLPVALSAQHHLTSMDHQCINNALVINRAKGQVQVSDQQLQRQPRLRRHQQQAIVVVKAKQQPNHIDNNNEQLVSTPSASLSSNASSSGCSSSSSVISNCDDDLSSCSTVNENDEHVILPDDEVDDKNDEVTTTLGDDDSELDENKKLQIQIRHEDLEKAVPKDKSQNINNGQSRVKNLAKNHEQKHAQNQHNALNNSSTTLINQMQKSINQDSRKHVQNQVQNLELKHDNNNITSSCSSSNVHKRVQNRLYRDVVDRNISSNNNKSLSSPLPPSPPPSSFIDKSVNANISKELANDQSESHFSSNDETNSEAQLPSSSLVDSIPSSRSTSTSRRSFIDDSPASKITSCKLLRQIASSCKNGAIENSTFDQHLELFNCDKKNLCTNNNNDNNQERCVEKRQLQKQQENKNAVNESSLLNVISEYFYPTVVGVSEFGDFKEALYHLENKVIATRSPEEIRGGGLLKYCNLLVRDYKPHNLLHMRTLERYMCSRFFIDFNDLNQQKAKLSSYLANHFNQDSQLKYDYLNILYDVVLRSTVCLMTHELRLTLTMIRELQSELLPPNQMNPLQQLCSNSNNHNAAASIDSSMMIQSSHHQHHHQHPNHHNQHHMHYQAQQHQNQSQLNSNLMNNQQSHQQHLQKQQQQQQQQQQHRQQQYQHHEQHQQSKHSHQNSWANRNHHHHHNNRNHHNFNSKNQHSTRQQSNYHQNQQNHNQTSLQVINNNKQQQTNHLNQQVAIRN